MDKTEFVAIRPTAAPKAWQVTHIPTSTEMTYYGGVTKTLAITRAMRTVEREGKLPHAAQWNR